MTTPKPGLAVLFFYAYSLTLSAALLCRNVPSEQAMTQASTLAMLAWLLVNRRWLGED
jgi:hypothetical protein